MDHRVRTNRLVTHKLILHKYHKDKTATEAARIICQTQGERDVCKYTCAN